MNHSFFPGFLIVIEGIDGAGKTTQAHFLQDALMARGLVVIRTKEPTSGQWGQMLRDSALTGRLSQEEEVEAFIKDRKEHVEEVILPALRQGQVVIVDRYYFSTAAYQGARGIDPDELIRRNEVFAPEPDLLVLLDVDPTEGLKRIRTRGDRANHFERTDTLQKAREIFLAIDKPYLLKLDSTQAPNVLRDCIMREFSQRQTERIAKSSPNLDPKVFQIFDVQSGSCRLSVTYGGHGAFGKVFEAAGYLEKYSVRWRADECSQVVDS